LELGRCQSGIPPTAVAGNVRIEDNSSNRFTAGELEVVVP
jgi:hypothetical protein